MNGFIAFSPENMIDNQCLNRPLFTSFRLFNVPVVSGEAYNGRVLFDKALSYSDEVQLKYDENYITLEFSGLNFPTFSNLLRYQLEGFDKEWTETLFENGQGRVVYNNLPSGEYIFRVSAAGNDRIWGPESAFKIVIHPPFWDTLAARFFYAILVILLIFGLIYVINRRNRQKMIRMQEEEALKQKEELVRWIPLLHKYKPWTPHSADIVITPLVMVIRRIDDDADEKTTEYHL